MFYNRAPQPSTAIVQTSGTKIFPAPRRGWIRNESLANSKPDGAEVLDNFFPTPEGGRLRKGSDKRATIGGANTILTGDFASDTNWTKDPNVTISGGAAHFTAVANGDGLSQTQSLANATIYGITFTVSNRSAGAVYPQLTGGTAVTGTAVTANGTYTQYLTAGSANTAVEFTASGTTTLDIDNVEVHAIQAVTHLTVYDAGGASKMFATSSSAIYDVTSPSSPDIPPTAAVTGQTSGDYCSFQVATSGGEFLMMFNGADLHQVYDGTSWAQNSPAITGVSTDDVSYGWKFKSFVFMIEQFTMDAWYLAAGTIGGAASVFPLGGVFQNGGSLLLGATWSQDSGAGLDDFCLFFTTEGEIAVYEGTNPGSASTFALVGVYQIGKPLHKNAWFRSGGDIIIATDDGLFPVSSVLNRDRTGQKAAAITYPIEEAWRLVINERSGTQFPFSCVLWHSETTLVVGIPTFGALEPICYVMNARTGAWCRYTGWDTRCVIVFDDEFYFGTAAGTVVQGEVTGADQDENYTGIWLPRFDTFGKAEEKCALHARLVARANNSFTPQLFANADYEVDTPTPLGADTDENSNAWDSGIWGPDANASTWGAVSDRKQKITDWQSVAATGHALSPGLQITSGRVVAPDIELIAMHLQYEVGEVMS